MCRQRVDGRRACARIAGATEIPVPKIVHEEEHDILGLDVRGGKDGERKPDHDENDESE